MLALAQIRDETCDGCGGHLPETTVKANEPLYEALGPFLCYSCEALGRARAGFAEKRAKNPVHNMNRWLIRMRKG